MTSQTIERRFWAKVDKSSDCWLWTAKATPKGYGMCFVGRVNGKKTMMYSHRLSWFLRHGEMPAAGLQVCHKCDTPRCVNPDHLFLGTNRDNWADSKAKGRARGFGGNGERHFASKLTTQKVKAIREAYRSGERAVSLASNYGIATSTLYKLLRGETWLELPASLLEIVS